MGEAITVQAGQPRQSVQGTTAAKQSRRIGVNLNQALRRGSVVDDELLREVKASVDRLRGALGDTTR